MAKLNKHTKRTAIIVVLLILTAMFLRIMSQYLPSNNLRGLIYIGLLTAWGVSVRRRIIQVQARRYLMATSALMVLWVVVRSIKFMPFSGPQLDRYCWYLYYFPMLFIPLLVLLVALSLGKPENFRLPKWTEVPLIISAVLFVLVLTNDLHQQAFAFSKGLLYFENNDYSHEPVYFLSMGWIVLCAVSAIAVMIVKCRVSGNKKLIRLPYVPLLALIVYAVLYVTAWDFIKPFAGDMTVVSCLLVTAVLESCIQGHLIQSNTGYDVLFEASSIKAQIVNDAYTVKYSSGPVLARDIAEHAEHGIFYLDRNTLLKSHPIRGGHVLWQEDITKLVAAVEHLQENQAELAQTNAVDMENYNTLLSISRIQEKNRLYDLLQEQTARQTALLEQLLNTYDASDSEEERRRLLSKAAVVGAYIKRRGNLVLLQERNRQLTVRELCLCFDESLQNLELMGVSCELTSRLAGELPLSSAARFYDLFEAVVEASLDDLSGLWIHLSETNGSLTEHIEALTEVDLLPLRTNGVEVFPAEDGSWHVTLCLTKGGEVL